MPLVTCPDCQHQVSTTAASCPQCGRPTASPRLSRRICEVTGFALIMLGLAGPISMMMMGMIGGYVLLCVSPGLMGIGVLIYIIGRFM